MRSTMPVKRRVGPYFAIASSVSPNTYSFEIFGHNSLAEQSLRCYIFKEIRHQGESPLIIPESVQGEGFYGCAVGDFVVAGFGDDFIDILADLKGIKHPGYYAKMPDGDICAVY